MLTTILSCRLPNELGAEGHDTAYQHNQTDLEHLLAESGAVGKADGVGVRWEGPDFDAARVTQHSDFFRPNPTGDGSTGYRIEQGFMDYTDDCCIGFATERNRHRVSDGTSNTLECSKG